MALRSKSGGISSKATESSFPKELKANVTGKSQNHLTETDLRVTPKEVQQQKAEILLQG